MTLPQGPVNQADFIVYVGVLLLAGYLLVWKPLADRVARLEGKEGYTPPSTAWQVNSLLEGGLAVPSKEGMIPHEPPVYYVNQDPDAVAANNLSNAMLEPDGEVAGVGWAPDKPAAAVEGMKRRQFAPYVTGVVEGMKSMVNGRALNPY